MKTNNLSLIFSIFLILAPLNAWAYLDAGTGSMAIQGIIGGLAAGIYFIKIYWHRFMAFLGLRKKKEEQDLDSVKVEDDFIGK